MSAISVISATLNANETKSSGVDLAGHQLVAIEMPATWTGTSITLESKSSRHQKVDTSIDDFETWKAVYDTGGNQITLTVAQNRIIVPTAAHAAALAPLRYIRVVVTPAQNPTKTIKFIVKEA